MSARKTRAKSREENHALHETFRPFCQPAATVHYLRFSHTHICISSPLSLVLSRCGSSQQKVQAASIHMTAQELCCAVASTLAGGKLPAEAVVHEDPAVLRLRLAAVTGT